MNRPFLPRRPVRLADEVAADLRREIRAAALQVGDRLPTEKALCERYGVSRSVVREAIARLKTEAVVRVRQGSGAFVSDPDEATFRIEGDTGRPDHLLKVYELRQGVEVAAAGLAAARRTRADLDRLDAAVAAMDDPETRARADVAFHTAVAAATGNDLYESFVGFIGHAVSGAIDAAVRNTLERHAKDQARVIAEHRRVLAAIRDGEPSAARRAMTLHIEAAMARLSLVRADLAAMRPRAGTEVHGAGPAGAPVDTREQGRTR